MQPIVLPTLLLAEDEPDIVYFFRHTMKSLGMTNPLQVAKDGREALDYLGGVGDFADRRKFPLPGLTLLDLKMPRATGFEVLEQVRRWPETRMLIVLILSSSASEEDIAKAYALGANGYLIKPLRLETLAEVVGAIRNFWLTHNCPPPLVRR
jgi:CheY-like chemotaxis protein